MAALAPDWEGIVIISMTLASADCNSSGHSERKKKRGEEGVKETDGIFEKRAGCFRATCLEELVRWSRDLEHRARPEGRRGLGSGLGNVPSEANELHGGLRAASLVYVGPCRHAS